MPTSEQIKTARERLGETQAQFGARFGVDQSTVHRWETKGLPDYGPTRMVVERLLSSLSKSEPKVRTAQE
jgi:DNA-binding transcriptional regulator YiaG